MINFYNLPKLNNEYISKFMSDTLEIIHSNRYIIGEFTGTFEKNFANYCGVKHAIGVGNGFDALTLAMRGLIILGKIKIGDEVIVPANTYIATVLSIVAAQLKPIFVEPELSTFNIDVNRIEVAITPRTKVILPVHLYGQPADMKSIMQIANSRDLLVIEDVAQAHGADIGGTRVGSFGDVGCFSFFPGKNLGAFGDAGGIITDNLHLNEVIISLRNYGEEAFSDFADRKYSNIYQGVNSRMDELQAAILRLKLPDLDYSNNIRRKIANKYLCEMNNQKIILPTKNSWSNSVWHLFVLRCKKRNEFIKHMKDCGVATMIHYPIPPHRQVAFHSYSSESYPITEQIHEQVVSIPLHPHLTEDEQDIIVSAVNSYKES